MGNLQNPQVTMGFNTTVYYNGLTTWMIWGATIFGSFHIGRWSLIPLIRINIPSVRIPNIAWMNKNH